MDILKPGLHLVNPVSENVIQVDMKTHVFGMQPQQIITKDNVSLQIETVVYYRSINPYKLVYKLNNDTRKMREFITEIAYAAMRTVTGENTFQELLVNRTEIAQNLEDYIKEKVYPWGLYIENLFIKGTTHHTQTSSCPTRSGPTSRPQQCRSDSHKPPSSPPRPTSRQPNCSRKLTSQNCS